MEKMLSLASAAGCRPDNLVCDDDLAGGRPGPVMMYLCFADLAVYPPETVIKVDNIIPGIAEARAANCVTVGISLTGNYVGLSEANVMALPEPKRNRLNEDAARKLRDVGADYVIDIVAALPALIDGLQ